jgi:MFS family permease
MTVCVPRRGPALALLCLASLGWAFSFGLGAPLSSLWLKQAGLSAAAIGLNTSLYYLGVAVAAPLVPWLMRRGSRACVLAGMLLDAFTTALFPLCDGAPAWHLLRAIGGIGTALSLIPMETLVNHNAPPDRRARDFAVYAVSVALGITLGSVVGVPLFPHVPRLAFALGGLVTLLASAVVWLAVPARHLEADKGTRRQGDKEKDTAAGSSVPLSPCLLVPLSASKAGLLGFGTAWAQGFLEGGTLTFLSIYLLALGHAEATVSALLGALFAGVVLAQLPVAWLADRLGRLRVLLACHALLLVGLACVPWARPAGLVGGWLFVLGACCGALYPLGLALLGERTPAEGLARANAWYLACNCAGSLSGPLVIGLAIDAFGLRAQFAAGALAVLAVLAVWAVVPARREARGDSPARRAA